jgi:hypothetical protein
MGKTIPPVPDPQELQPGTEPEGSGTTRTRRETLEWVLIGFAMAAYIAICLATLWSWLLPFFAGLVTSLAVAAGSFWLRFRFGPAENSNQKSLMR